MMSTSVKSWLIASRPKTLIATIAPISIGATLALDDGVFAWPIFLIALASALFIQIGTNLANDYYDFQKGADNAERVGPKRVTQSGIIAPYLVRRGFLLCFFMAALFGLYLVFNAGSVIVWVGLASIASGFAYTAGPCPLAYVGLGEVFVLVFFGPIASGFTYFVMSHDMNYAAFMMGLCPGMLSCAILVANNLRDADQDAKNQKRTLVVRFGKKFAKVEYAFAWIGAYCLIGMFAIERHDVKILLPLITVPMAVQLLRKVQNYQHPVELVKVLEGTAKTLAVFSFLLCLGILL